jgi:uncharacterized RDD family membrane protein YckC
MSSTNPYAPPRGAVRDVPDANDEYRLAGRGTRLVAVILDGLIGGIMIYAPFFIVAIAMGGFGNLESGEVNGTAIGGGLLASLVGLIAWIWITIRNVVRNGQTIAKKLMSIKVVRRDGSPVSLGRIFWLRNVVNILLGIIPLYGLIDALLIFGEERQCVHDKLADTIVVVA